MVRVEGGWMDVVEDGGVDMVEGGRMWRRVDGCGGRGWMDVVEEGRWM